MTPPIKAAELFDLTGEVALVTGASSGLGRRFAQTLAANGAKVVVAARRLDRLEALAGEIRQAGGAAHAVSMDAADADTIGRAFDAAEAAFGPVTILVNNAGIAGNKLAMEMSREDWRRVISVNLDGVWFTAQESARRMIAAERPGAIVNVASILGFMASKSVAAYAASKGGVIQLTRVLALELIRHDIRVNALAPGYVLSEMTGDFFVSRKGKEMMATMPQKRIAEPHELDGALLLLAAPRASSYMTGAVVTVDGGQSVSLDR